MLRVFASLSAQETSQIDFLTLLPARMLVVEGVEKSFNLISVPDVPPLEFGKSHMAAIDVIENRRYFHELQQWLNYSGRIATARSLSGNKAVGEHTNHRQLLLGTLLSLNHLQQPASQLCPAQFSQLHRRPPDSTFFS